MKQKPVWADTPDNRKVIRRMVEERKTDAQIGQHFGVSRSRIAPLIKEAREDYGRKSVRKFALPPQVFHEAGIEFRRRDDGLSDISPTQMGMALIFLQGFKSVENAKLALDEVAKLKAA